jgi:hypothetical protein
MESDDTPMSDAVFMREVVHSLPEDIPVRPRDVEEISDASDSSDHRAADDDRIDDVDDSPGSIKRLDPESEPEPISDLDQFDEGDDDDDGIDTSNLQEFFRRRRVVFEFMGDEPDQLQRWDCKYSRVMLVRVIESQIANRRHQRLVVSDYCEEQGRHACQAGWRPVRHGSAFSHIRIQ